MKINFRWAEDSSQNVESQFGMGGYAEYLHWDYDSNHIAGSVNVQTRSCIETDGTVVHKLGSK